MIVLTFLAAPVRNDAAAQEPDGLAAARILEGALVDTIARAEGAVVAVSRDSEPPAASGRDPFDPFGLAVPNQAPLLDRVHTFPKRFGSGVIVQHPQRPDERFVLTTCHVAFGEERPSAERALRVVLRAQNGYSASVRAVPHAADRRIDLAVLRLQLDDADVTADDIQALPLGDAEGIKKGRFVIALGNPYATARDGSSSASIGIVSNLARRPQFPRREGAFDENSSIHEYGTLLTVDTRLQIGASGGALLNLDGELIGITTALAALQGYEKSVGYAIPLDAGTRRIVLDLLNGHEAEYGFLGVSPEPFRWAAAGRIARVRVAHVAHESPAHQAGLRSGDLILQINERPVHDVGDLMRMIGLLGPGAEARLLVQRGGGAAPLEIAPRLGKWPVYDDADVLSTQPRYPVWRGLTVDYPTARQRYLSSDRLEQYRRAVVVTNVAAGSPAAAAGMKAGNFIARVDGTDVQTPAEFHAAVSGRQEPLTLTLWSGDQLRVER